MLLALLQFEWHYHSRKSMLYALCIAFPVLGYLLGSSGNILFPNVYGNASYTIIYLVGLLSLAAIFTTTMLVAQSGLREQETKFDVLIFATPVKKFPYLFSRIISLTAIALFSFVLAILGLFLGHYFGGLPAEKAGPFHVWFYVEPFVLLALPNLLLCISILYSTAWLAKNKLVVYICGLLIYIIYLVSSIFSNSPLLAGSAPATAAQMNLFAKLDPFGIASFFEQTRYWSTAQRNTMGLQLEGNFLFNRILWLCVTVILLVISYAGYRFKTCTLPKSKKTCDEPGAAVAVRSCYRKVATEAFSKVHTWQAFIGTAKLDLAALIKSIPFFLVFLLWTTLLGVELFGAMSSSRMGPSYASTSIILTTIKDTLPFYSLLVCLFFSSGVMQRSVAMGFDGIEQATPVSPLILKSGKLMALSSIPVMLVLYGVVIGVLIQFYKGTEINWSAYVSLFYFLALPLVLNVVMMVAMQNFFDNKYLALAVAALFIFLFTSSTGKMIGITNPLLRFAEGIHIGYHDMNGFGLYTTSFHWKTLYATAFGVLLFTASLWLRYKTEATRVVKAPCIGALVVLLTSGSFIGYNYYTEARFTSVDQRNDWMETYERRYKKYKDDPAPSISSMRADVDLFPSRGYYKVRGTYILENKTSAPIKSLMVYKDQETLLEHLSIQGAKREKEEAVYGHYWYILDSALLPGDTTQMQFSFSSHWSPFVGHTAFNSIIGNGTFIRMSQYFPSFGYADENEITNSVERTKRALGEQEKLTALEAPLDSPYRYDYLHLDVTVSTEKDQVVVGVGDLVSNWKEDGRAYYRYRTPDPVPFRFAFSSARYEVRRDSYKDIPIEIYFDSRHSVNVDSLIREAKNTLRYCEAQFIPYPHKQLRFAEVSAFAEGFAGTAYPSVIFMKEDGGFYNDIRGGGLDNINMLAGHELAHQWWGAAQILPPQREGAWILTETIAKYIELVLYEAKWGRDVALRKVQHHLDLYLSKRSYSEEAPLYKISYETPHLPYDKGLVVMHQLRLLVGDMVINSALRELIIAHSFPKMPPTSLNFLNALYQRSSPQLHAAIRALFQEIIILEASVEHVNCRVRRDGTFLVDFVLTAKTFQEDGKGNRSLVIRKTPLDVGMLTKEGQWLIKSFVAENGTIKGEFTTMGRPLLIKVDPMLKNIDGFLKDNEKEITAPW